MNWLDKLERKFRKYAVNNLMFYIIILNALGFIIQHAAPEVFGIYFSMNAEKILQGQVWRLVTFLLQPPSDSLFTVVLMLYLYNMIGRQLERSWGAFRFNIYIFSGILFHAIAVIVIYLIFGFNFPVALTYMYFSLFFAFATLYGEVQFLLFFIIPVKVKYLAWINGIYFIWTITMAFLPAYGGDPILGVFYKANAVSAVISLLNFFLFYLSSRNAKKYAPKQVYRKVKFKQMATPPKKNYGNGAMHKCVICGKTEIDDERLEFRYCSKCSGSHEYCQEHLFTHEHK